MNSNFDYNPIEQVIWLICASVVYEWYEETNIYVGYFTGLLIGLNDYMYVSKQYKKLLLIIDSFKSYSQS